MKLGGADVNWSKMSDQFENLPDGDYDVEIDSIEEDVTKESKLPQAVVKMTVFQGDAKDKKVTDFVVLQTREGKRNDMGFGRMRAYHEAILKQPLADGEEVDTDQLVKGRCTIIVRQEAAKKKPGDTEEKIYSKIKKVIPLA